MNEFHGIGIISPSSDKFHEERTWVCLDIVDEIREFSPWCFIGFWCLIDLHFY
jgi:hypothetical protein